MGSRLHVDVDQGIKVTVDFHQLLVALRLLILVQVEPDERPLGVLTLIVGNFVAAVENLDVGQPRNDHPPPLVGRVLFQEGAMLDSQLRQVGVFPQLVEIAPMLDLGDVQVETIEVVETARGVGYGR